MNCSNCGAPLRDGAAFCPVCGKEVAYGYGKPTVERSVVDGKPMDKKLLVTIIAAVSLVIICIVAFCVYWFVFRDNDTSETDNDVKICKECEKEFEGSGKYCKDCKDKSGGNKETKCATCGASFMGDGFVCEDCIDGADREIYSDAYFCFVCETELFDYEIAYVDNNGYVYCEDCDKDYSCQECGDTFKYGEGYKHDGDFYCDNCVEDIIIGECRECKNDIYKGEDYVSVDDGDYYYCMSCCSGVCENCNVAVLKDDEYKYDGEIYCGDCYSGTCADCGDLLLKNDYETFDGAYYCDDCYEKNVVPDGVKGECSVCGDYIYANDASCYLEGKYYCMDCYEDDPVECYYCGKDILNGTIYTINGKYCCKNCSDKNSSTHFCTNCGTRLELDDDDDVCTDCARYSCADCEEVITYSEIKYEDDGGNVYCEDCAQ